MDKIDIDVENEITEEIKDGIDGEDYVICGECGKKMKQVSYAHITKIHNMTMEEYRSKYPGRLISKIVMEKNIESNNKTRNGLTKICKVCGKEIDWSKEFCSSSCRASELKSPLINRNCLYCGSNFYSKIKDTQKFCSLECYRNFTTGISKKETTEKLIQSIKNIYDNKCSLCGRDENLRIHHIDQNHENNIEENLILLCESCHRKIHSRGGLTVTVYRTVTIETCHWLPGHSHCGNLHGHSIDITVGVKGPMNLKTGMVMDFSDLKKIMQEIIEDKFDHNCLNNYLLIPTSEYLSFYIFKELKKISINVVSVKVHETKNNYAIFESENF